MPSKTKGWLPHLTINEQQPGVLARIHSPFRDRVNLEQLAHGHVLGAADPPLEHEVGRKPEAVAQQLLHRDQRPQTVWVWMAVGAQQNPALLRHGGRKGLKVRKTHAVEGDSTPPEGAPGQERPAAARASWAAGKSSLG